MRVLLGGENQGVLDNLEHQCVPGCVFAIQTSLWDRVSFVMNAGDGS